MQVMDDSATALAQADAKLRTDAKVALAGVRALRENLAKLAEVVAKLENASRQ